MQQQLMQIEEQQPSQQIQPVRYIQQELHPMELEPQQTIQPKHPNYSQHFYNLIIKNKGVSLRNNETFTKQEQQFLLDNISIIQDNTVLTRLKKNPRYKFCYFLEIQNFFTNLFSNELDDPNFIEGSITSNQSYERARYSYQHRVTELSSQYESRQTKHLINKVAKKMLSITVSNMRNKRKRKKNERKISTRRNRKKSKNVVGFVIS